MLLSSLSSELIDRLILFVMMMNIMLYVSMLVIDICCSRFDMLCGVMNVLFVSIEKNV